MSSELLGFLTGLATEPSAMSSCMKDPASAMKSAKLSEDEQAALLSRDTAKIHAAITGKQPDPVTTPTPQSANAKMVADILASDPAVAQWLQSLFLQSMQSWGMQPEAAAAPAAPGTPPPEPQPDDDDDGESGKKAEGEEKKDG